VNSDFDGITLGAVTTVLVRGWGGGVCELAISPPPLVRDRHCLSRWGNGGGIGVGCIWQQAGIQFGRVAGEQWNRN